MLQSGVWNISKTLFLLPKSIKFCECVRQFIHYIYIKWGNIFVYIITQQLTVRLLTNFNHNIHIDLLELVVYNEFELTFTRSFCIKLSKILFSVTPNFYGVRRYYDSFGKHLQLPE